MASYDSDSSLEEDTSYQTTNVLLGYASKEPSDDTISIIGGEPLLQLHADLPERFPSHERRLHIFACRRRACARKPGSVRALRSVRQAYAEEPRAAPAPPPPAKEPSPPRDLGGAIFGGGKLFGGGGSNSDKPATPTQSKDLASTFADKARITSDSPATSIVKPSAPESPPEPWPTDADRPKAYPMYYLDAEYEELDAPPAGGPSNAPIPTVEADTDSAGPSSAAEDAEAFESTLDRTFQRFADRLAQNPEQVLRYEFRGSPLLAANDDAVGQMLQETMPSCPRCTGPRVFEVQLVPGAIDALESEEMGIEGMEWSTIIVGVCTRDCAGEIGACIHAEEWAGVQWEEIRKPGEGK